MEMKEFMETWGEPFQQLKYILQYLGTYGDFFRKIKIENFIDPEQLESIHADFLRQQAGLEGIDKEFFKSCWVQIDSEGDYMVDLSTEGFQVIMASYVFVEPYQWIKTIAFESIRDMMLAYDERMEIEDINRKYIAERARKCQENSIRKN